MTKMSLSDVISDIGAKISKLAGIDPKNGI